MKKLVAEYFDFADSEYISLELTEDLTLIINMKNWQEDPFKIIFKNTRQFLFKLGDVPKDLFEVTGDISFLKEALICEYGTIPSNQPYKLYQLEDIDDFPFIQIVAESVQIIKE